MSRNTIVVFLHEIQNRPPRKQYSLLEDVNGKQFKGSLGEYMMNRFRELKKIPMDRRRKLFQEAIFKEGGGLHEPMVKQYRVVGETKAVKP